MAASNNCQRAKLRQKLREEIGVQSPLEEAGQPEQHAEDMKSAARDSSQRFFVSAVTPKRAMATERQASDMSN